MTAIPTPSLPMRDFAHSLPMALLKAREAVMAGFRPDLEAHGLTEQQWRVLRVLTEHPGITAGELAERAAAAQAQPLPHRRPFGGAWPRRPPAGARDLRLARLTMTVAGHRLVRKIAPRSEARYRAIEAAFGGEQLAELHGMLEALMASLEPRRVSA